MARGYLHNLKLEQEQLELVHALIEDAAKDTILWLQANPSAEERVCVLAIQRRLAELDGIIARRMELRRSPKDGWEWSETVTDVLSLVEKAKEVRGNIVGKGLTRLVDRLPRKLPGSRPKPKLPAPVKPVNTSWGAGPRDIREAEHPAKPEAPTERANQSVLPPGLCGVGDPVDGNPFPPENPRYAHWQQATLKAEEELCLLNVQFMKNSITRERFAEWMQRGGPFSAERELAAWTLNFVAAKFDIWAKRACHVVWDEYDLKVFDKWLFDYAESWLRAERDAGRDAILPELRTRLIERMEYWKAAARGTLSALRRVDAENSNKTAQNVQPGYQEQVEKYSRWSDTELALRFGKAGQYVKELCATEEKLRGNWSRRSETALELREKREKLVQILLRDLKLVESPHQGAVVEFRDVLAAGVGRNDSEGVGEPIPPQSNGKTTQAERKLTEAAVTTRKSVLMPLLTKNNFSVHDWAREAGVDWHTADDYLNGKTKPYQSTLGKLAAALKVEVEDMPA